MSSVQLFHRSATGTESLVGVIDGDLIKAHSATIRNLIATRPQDIIHRVTLRGPTVEGLKLVLDQVQVLQNDEVLEININTRNIEKAIDVHRAVECMKIEPPQTKIEGHLNGFLSHELPTPKEMVAIHNAYGAPSSAYVKVWNTMVHTIAYKWVGGDIPQDTIALKRVARDHPALDAALNKRVDQLEKIRKRQQEANEKRATKKAANAKGN